MNLFRSSIIIFFLCSLGWGNLKAQEFVSPESQGVASEHVQFCFDSLMNIDHGEVHGVVVMRHGKVIAELYPEPFNREYSHTLYSVSKTFLAVAVGLAVDDNRLRVSDRVPLFFPEYLPDSISDGWASMTLRDLLTMTSGFHPDWNLRNVESDWIKTLLKKEVNQPGMKFKYDSMVSYLLSVIVQKVTGENVLDYLNRRIFKEIGIFDAEWEMSPEGFCTGGWGLRMSTLSMAKFGQLLLNNGAWNGKQLLSVQWVKEMMSEQQQVNASQLYGYHIWKHDDVEGAFRADGALGQYIIIAPKEDMVIAITQCNRGNGILERQLINDWLLRKASESSREVGVAYQKLLASSYTLPVAKGNSSFSSLKKIFDKEILLNSNDLGWKTIRLNQEGKFLKVDIVTFEGEQFSFLSAHNKWLSDTTNVCPPYSIKALGRFSGISKNFIISSSYGRKDNTLSIKVLYPNWISGVELLISVENRAIKVRAKENYKKKFSVLK